MAIGSYFESDSNYVQILEVPPQKNAIARTRQVPHMYAPTMIKFHPKPNQLDYDLFATSSDFLRIFKVTSDSADLMTTFKLKTFNNLSAPLASFDWNRVHEQYICCSSLDTTCTIWDITKEKDYKKIITHDKEVFDVCFDAEGNLFATVGADHTARIFDMRNYHKSEIIYESQEPLLRIQFNPIRTSLLAFSSLYDTSIVILDYRRPYNPFQKLSFHKKPVSNISWAPRQKTDKDLYLCSISDDMHAYIWNLENMNTGQPLMPAMEYNSDHQLYNLSWCQSYDDWIGIVKKHSFNMLRIMQ